MSEDAMATGERLGERICATIAIVPTFARDHAANDVIAKIDALMQAADARREVYNEQVRKTMTEAKAKGASVWLGCYILTPVLVAIVWAMTR